MISNPLPAAPFRVKLLFWLLLGAGSVILAEVVSFSSPFPFFDGWGLLVVFPLYTLHVLVLAWIVFRPKRLTLSALFLAGALLGLYEAYITKVLWQPTWGDSTLTAGGVYVVQTAILVLFWHPMMAFMLPLFAAEGLFTSSRETPDSLPQGLRRRLGGRRAPLAAAVFGGVCGLYQAVGSPSPGVSLLSGLAAGLVFGVLVLLWRRATHRQAYPLRALLPSNRQALVLGLLLLAVYLVQGITLRPEALPRTLGPHLTIWALYLLFGLLLWLNLRWAPALPQAVKGGEDPKPPTPGPSLQDAARSLREGGNLLSGFCPAPRGKNHGISDSPPFREGLGVGLLQGLPPSNPEPAAAGPGHFISWKLLAVFWVVFPLTSAAATLFKPAAGVVALLTWGIGVAAGALLLLRSLLAPGRV